MGVESGTFAVGSRVRLRAGEDWLLAVSIGAESTMLEVGGDGGDFSGGGGEGTRRVDSLTPFLDAPDRICLVWM